MQLNNQYQVLKKGNYYKFNGINFYKPILILISVGAEYNSYNKCVIVNEYLP
jgi:hypothetical protein